jgi:hypothetical protein
LSSRLDHPQTIPITPICASSLPDPSKESSRAAEEIPKRLVEMTDLVEMIEAFDAAR